MGVSKTITVACDLPGCKAVLTWNETDVERGKAEAPEESKYLVLFAQNQVLKSFCCQLHAAAYFLPPGYEAKQKSIIELPKPQEKPDNAKWVVPERPKSWTEEPPRHESPVNGPEVSGFVYGEKNNGPGGVDDIF